MYRAGDRLVDVELVEVELDEDDDATDTTGRAGVPDDRYAPPGLRALLRRLPPRFWAATAAAVLLGGAGGTVALRVADSALDARLAEVGGLSASLAAPLEEVWRAAGSGPIAMVDDLLIHWSPEVEGAVATDLDDGSTRYQHPGSCQLELTGDDAEARRMFRGPVVEGRPGDLLLCVQREPGPGGTDAAGMSTGHVLDPMTGQVLHTGPIAAHGSWSVVGTDVVSVGLDVDHHPVAERWSLETGEHRWSYRGDDPAPLGNSGWGTAMGPTTIGIEQGEWSVTLDTATGLETDPADGVDSVAEPFPPVPLPGGGTMVFGPSPSGRLETTVQPPGDAQPFTIPGFMLLPLVDDGSLPGTVIVLGADGTDGEQRLSLVERTGEVRWTSAVPAGAVAVVSGQVLVNGGDQVSALDGTTGATRWTSEADPSSMFGLDLVTDGHHLLVVEGQGEARSLVARDLRTGEPIWTAPSPAADATLASTPDGTVLVMGLHEMVALRP